MGRALAKRFFGNTNTGGLSGDGVASITVGGTNNAYIVKPTITIDPPTLPGGVTAVGAAHMAVVGITNFTSGTAITPLQVLTLTGGTGTTGTIRVNTTSIATLAVGSSGGTGYTTGDTVTILGGTGTLGTATVVCAGGPGTAVTSFSTFTPGSYTVNPAVLTDAATSLLVPGVPGGDDNLVVDITMGANTCTIVTGGDYSVLPADVSIVGSGSGNPLFNLTFKVLSVVLSVAGSGYAVAPAVTESSPDGNATFTAVLTTIGENSIVAHAYTGAGIKNADIVKQTGSHRYMVNTSDTLQSGVPAVCYLKSSEATALTQMNILAYDEAGGTYYVTKLTRHHAVITPGTGVVYAAGSSVGWTFDTAVDSSSLVKIENT